LVNKIAELDRDVQVLPIAGETNVKKTKSLSIHFSFLLQLFRKINLILNFNLMIILIKFNVKIFR